jgi:hypothetical protein
MIIEFCLGILFCIFFIRLCIEYDFGKSLLIFIKLQPEILKETGVNVTENSIKKNEENGKLENQINNKEFIEGTSRQLRKKEMLKVFVGKKQDQLEKSSDEDELKEDFNHPPVVQDKHIEIEEPQLLKRKLPEPILEEKFIQKPSLFMVKYDSSIKVSNFPSIEIFFLTI